MPIDAYTTLLNLEIFSEKYLKLKKLSKYWSLKETGASYKLAFVSTGNPGQNIFRKISNKSREDRENFISIFAYFLGRQYQTFIAVEEPGH